jgi:putative photosynthetic complex assembly protein 2
VRAILWHELGILAVGLVIVAITWNAPNQVGTGTFVVLWVMRTSAKLNLFLGVRNLSEEFCRAPALPGKLLPPPGGEPVLPRGGHRRQLWRWP